MITYNASDIIKKATQLADLENSDFLSWNENLTLLNDAYEKVYQDMINQQDKYWLKTVYLAANAQVVNNETYYILPSDFYQIQSVNLWPSMAPILRRSKNEPKSGQRYDFVNGRLVIYGSITGRVELQYYPKPSTLTFPAKDVATALDSQSWLDCNNNKYLYIDGTSVHVYDISTSTDTAIATLPLAVTSARAVLGTKEAIIWSGAGTYGSTSFYVIDLLTGTVNTVTGNAYPAKIGQQAYLVDSVQSGTTYTHAVTQYSYAQGSWHQYILYGFSTSTNIFAECDMMCNCSIDTVNELAYVCKTISGTSSVYSYSIADHTFTALAQYFAEMPIEVINQQLIYNDVSNNIYAGSQLAVSGAKVAKIVGVNKADLKTGYGITIISTEDTSVYLIVSPFVDTVLSYPCNILYTILSYYLAIAYKIKQNADAAELSQQVSAMERQYFDMINNDANGYVRIANAYSAGCLI